MIPKLGWCPFCSAYLPLQSTRLSLVSCPLDDYTLPSSLLHGAKLLYRFIFFVLLANSMCRPDQRHDMLFFHHFAFLSNPTTQYSVVVRVGFRKPLPLQHSRCESQLAGVTTDSNGLAVVALLVAVFTSLHFGCRTPRSHSSTLYRYQKPHQVRKVTTTISRGLVMPTYDILPIAITWAAP
jgi:hypothetical protein